MADNKVLSKNVVFAMKVDDVFYPIFCAKSCQWPVDQDEIEITSVPSGANREYVPGMSNSTISATGITELNNNNDRISINYLTQQAIRRTIHELRVLQTDNDGNALSATFLGFVINTTLTKEQGTYSGSSVTFRITGAITYSDIIPGPGEPICEVQAPLYITGTEGEIMVQASFLKTEAGITKTILEVQREGTGFDETTGTPANREFKYTADGSFGYITFNTDNPFNPGGETVYILYKTVLD